MGLLEWEPLVTSQLVLIQIVILDLQPKKPCRQITKITSQAALSRPTLDQPNTLPSLLYWTYLTGGRTNPSAMKLDCNIIYLSKNQGEDSGNESSQYSEQMRPNGKKPHHIKIITRQARSRLARSGKVALTSHT